MPFLCSEKYLNNVNEESILSDRVEEQLLNSLFQNNDIFAKDDRHWTLTVSMELDEVRVNPFEYYF